MKLLFDPSSALQTLVTKYSAVMEVMDGQARQQDADGERAYGGAVRAVKGQLQEFLTEQLILIAWRSIGGKSERLRVNSAKIPIPIIPEYVATLKDPEVREFVAIWLSPSLQ